MGYPPRRLFLRLDHLHLGNRNGLGAAAPGPLIRHERDHRWSLVRQRAAPRRFPVRITGAASLRDFDAAGRYAHSDPDLRAAPGDSVSRHLIRGSTGYPIPDQNSCCLPTTESL